MNLGILIAALICLHFYAGGILPESQYLIAIGVNFAAAVELYKQYKENRVLSVSLLALVTSFFLINALFFLPNLNVFISEQKQFDLDQVNKLINMGSELKLWTSETQDTYLGGSFWRGFYVMLNLIALPSAVFLSASLKHKEKLILSYALVISAL